MTQATRNGLIGLLDSPAVAEIDQAVMDAYLAPYSSHADYVERATGETVYFSVQATAEYHEHWERIRNASTVTETLKNDDYCPSCGTGGPDGCVLCGRTVAETLTETTWDECPFDCGKPPYKPGAIFCLDCHNERERKAGRPEVQP